MLFIFHFILFQVFFLVKIDGQEINRQENYDPRSFEDVRVYAGDSFNDPANARYKNLHYENIEEDPITIGKGGFFGDILYIYVYNQYKY